VLKLHWFLPTGGDARDVLPDADDPHRRAPSLSYLAQIAVACDQLGFDGMLTPCGTGCEDAWLATASLIPLTRRVRFLVAFRPTLLTPTLAAQMASTYQRLSDGRLLVNIVTGAEPAELARFGVFEDKDTRYERTGEFIEVMRGAWSGSAFSYSGAHYRVEAATTRAVPSPVPRIYFGGASEAAERIAAQHVDVYLAWGEPPAMVSERVERMRKLADSYGRELDFGIRFHVIARPTADEAWAAAEALVARMSPEAIAAAQADFATTQSVGQSRMAGLHGGDQSKLVVHPNVWAGIGLVRGGVGTALVGSYTEVADRIEEYAALGFSEFILSGYPHLEEAYWFGEGVLPELRRRGALPPLEGPGAPVFSFR
jgi:alkanesulfonate monooxygenase